MNRFDGVIFDLDGTLIDSLRDIANAANATLQELGKPTCTLESFKTHVGDGVSVLFQRALPETQSDPSLLAQCMSVLTLGVILFAVLGPLHGALSWG